MNNCGGPITIYRQGPGGTSGSAAIARPSMDALETPYLVAASQTQLTIKEATYIKVINSGSHTIIPFDTDTTFAVADKLDAGVMEAGKDYYVYVCDNGEIVVSLNSTFPAGYSADNSRKIGGFHTLCVAVGTIAGHPLTDFAVKAILPASVWCLNHRPWCSPEGMVWSEQARVWVDIYLQSSTGATTASVNGATITDTRVWHDHVEDLAAVKKRLLNDDEFALIAEGSNQKTNIAGLDPVTTGGHSDTAGRRMISNIGVEDACGAMWQWLRNQSYRFDRGPVTYVAGAQTTTLYHAAAPGGNPIYVKFTNNGSPYLCSNLATVTVDVVLTFGTNYKVVIKHDAGAATGLPLYFDYGATLPYRFLVNNTILGKDCYALSNDPNYLLPIKHDASAPTNGVAVNYDDGADNRLEYVSPGAADATMDLAMTHNEPRWSYQDLGSNKGSVYKQGAYGDIKLRAGGSWSDGASCGSRCLHASIYRWSADMKLGARGCAESR